MSDTTNLMRARTFFFFSKQFNNAFTLETMRRGCLSGLSCQCNFL